MREVKPTQKPVPSSDIKDLFFNSGLLDIWATSLEHKYIDRFGNCHLTAAGMEWIFNELVTKFKIESEKALLAAGYAPVGTFQEGAEVVSRNGTVLWKLPDGDGDHYRWDGDLPKQVPASSTPQSTGGVGKGAWVSVGDASLRGDLYRDSGASFVGYKYPSQKTIKRDVGSKLADYLTFDDFGIIGDGIADDTASLQNAIEFCISSRVNLHGSPGKVCRTTSTIYIPNLPTHTAAIKIDFGGLIIKPDSSIANVVLSGRKVGDVWQSIMDEPVLAYPTYGLTLSNLVVINDDISNVVGRVAFGFKDFHQNAKIENFRARNFATGFIYDNCYYLETDRTMIINVAEVPRDGTTGYVFKRASNLMRIHKPIATNVRDGFVFEREVTGVVISSPSFERQGVSLITKGEVFDMSIVDGYLEYVGDERGFCFDFQTYANVKFTNNYIRPHTALSLFNFRSSPRINIDFDSSNIVVGVAIKDYFYNKGIGYNSLSMVNSPQSANLGNTLFRASELGSGVDIISKTIRTTSNGDVCQIANVVNEFVPTYSSGRVNGGFIADIVYGMYDIQKDTTSGKCTLSSKIIYSDMQHLIFHLRIGGVIRDINYIGTIWGDTLYKPDGTIDTRVAIINDAGFVKIQVSGIDVGNFNIKGGQIRHS